MRLLPRRDPLADPESLIRRVYAYAAYRLGGSPASPEQTWSCRQWE